jgi:glycerophosphoryl diester phosphodiesterase
MADPFARHSRPARGRPWAIAHRGASHLAPENTLSAVRSALALGADMVEVDVRRTADGALVLMHDATLARTTDAVRVLPSRAPWRVQDLTLDEIRALDAGSWKSSTFAGEVVPTLEEAWEVTDRAGTQLLVEVKEPAAHPGIERDVAELVRAHGGRAGVVVQSFDTPAMHRLVHEVPGLDVGVLTPVPARRLPALASWATYLNPHHRLVDNAYLDRVHAAGLTCLPWTVDDPRRIRRLLRAGADGVISNRPDLVRAVRAPSVGAHRAD